MPGGRIWIDEGDEVILYRDPRRHYRVRVRVRIPYHETFVVDLPPRSCRALARNLDIAAELAEEKGK